MKTNTTTIHTVKQLKTAMAEAKTYGDQWKIADETCIYVLMVWVEAVEKIRDYIDITMRDESFLSLFKQKIEKH